MTILRRDDTILLDLAGQVVEIAEAPEQESREAAWRALNSGQRSRPLVWIDGVPWSEFATDRDMVPQCANAFCRDVEMQLRRTLYRWAHFRGDMVVTSTIYSRVVLHGEKLVVDAPGRSAAPATVHDAGVEVDDAATRTNHERLVILLGDLLQIEGCGVRVPAFAPWEALESAWGSTPLQRRLSGDPVAVRMAAEALMSAQLRRLDEYERLNVLSLNNGGERVGRGGLGFTDDLPAPEFDPGRVLPRDLWGAATAAAASPDAEAPWADLVRPLVARWCARFGLACVEVSGTSDDVAWAGTVPTLRKLCLRAAGDAAEALQALSPQVVVSCRANAETLTGPHWDLAGARRELEAMLRGVWPLGHAVEVVLDGIGTLRGEPRRLREWADMAREVTAQFTA